MATASVLASLCALACVVMLCMYCEVGAQLIGREESPQFPVVFTTRDRDFQPDVFWATVAMLAIAFIGTLTTVEVSKANSAGDAVLPRQQVSFVMFDDVALAFVAIPCKPVAVRAADG